MMPLSAASVGAQRSARAAAAVPGSAARGNPLRAGLALCRRPPAARCLGFVARAAPAGGPGRASSPSSSPSSPAAAPDALRSPRGVAAAAAAALSAPPVRTVAPDNVAVAATLASYDDPGADATQTQQQQQQQQILRARAGVGGGAAPAAAGTGEAPAAVCLEAEAAALEGLLARLRACGGGVRERLAMLEAHPRVAALREATR